MKTLLSLVFVILIALSAQSPKWCRIGRARPGTGESR